MFDTLHIPVFLKSVGFGLAVAAPVGPMSLLCMRRTLTTGWRSGLATGAGIAVGDGIYAAVAAAGLAGVSRWVLAYERPLHLAAGLVLLWLGLKTFLARRVEAPADAPDQASLPGQFAGSAILTLTNPPTIIMFAAIFTAIAPAGGFEPAAAGLTVAGVLAGSLAWWCVVVGGVSLLRQRIGGRARVWVDRVAGGVLGVFGGVEVVRAVTG